MAASLPARSGTVLVAVLVTPATEAGLHDEQVRLRGDERVLEGLGGRRVHVFVEREGDARLVLARRETMASFSFGSFFFFSASVIACEAYWSHAVQSR